MGMQGGYGSFAPQVAPAANYGNNGMNYYQSPVPWSNMSQFGNGGYMGESFAPIGRYGGNVSASPGWRDTMGGLLPGQQYPGGPIGGQYTPGTPGISYDDMSTKQQGYWNKILGLAEKGGMDVTGYESGIPGTPGSYNPWTGGDAGGFNYGPGWNSAAGAGGFYGQNQRPYSMWDMEMRNNVYADPITGMPPLGSNRYDANGNLISRQDQYKQASQNWTTNYNDRQSKLLTDAGFTKGVDGRWKNASGQEADLAQYAPNMDDIQRPGMNPAWEAENRLRGPQGWGGWGVTDPTGTRVDRHVMTTQGDFAIPENWKPGDPIPGFDPNKMNVNQETLGTLGQVGQGQTGGPNVVAPQQPQQPQQPTTPEAVPNWLKRNQNQQARIDTRLGNIQGKLDSYSNMDQLGQGQQRRYDRLLNRQTRLQNKQQGLTTKAAGYQPAV